MATSLMGIEIGNTNIKIIEVVKHSTTLIVKRFSLLKTPSDCINNGMISNSDPIKKVIAKELKAKKYKTKKVVVVIQSSNIIIRNVMMEKQPEKIIEQLIEIKTEDFLPIERAQYQIDFKIIEEVEEEGVIKNRLMLVAAPNAVVLPVASLMKSLKLIPVSITIPSEALQSVFHSQTGMLYEAGDNILVLDFGGKSTTVTIIVGGEVCLTRLIEFSVENLSKKLNEAQTSMLKSDEEQDDYFAEVIMPQIEYNIVSELERILQFYYSSYGNNRIKKIYLIGGGANIKGIREYIRDALNIPTERVSHFDSITEIPNIGFEDYTRFFVNSLGAINSV